MAEQLFVALYTDADVIISEWRRVSFAGLLFALPQSLPRADYHGPRRELYD